MPRPTKYEEKMDEQVFKLALLGLDDKEMANILLVSERTLNRWKNEHPTFCQSIQKGKGPADAEVAASLFKRACGFEYEESTNYVDKEGNTSEQTNNKYSVPDTGAAFIWLKNRRSGKWRDKREMDITQKVVDVSLELDGGDFVDESED